MGGTDGSWADGPGGGGSLAPEAAAATSGVGSLAGYSAQAGGRSACSASARALPLSGDTCGERADAGVSVCRRLPGSSLVGLGLVCRRPRARRPWCRLACVAVCPMRLWLLSPEPFARLGGVADASRHTRGAAEREGCGGIDAAAPARHLTRGPEVGLLWFSPWASAFIRFGIGWRRWRGRAPGLQQGRPGGHNCGGGRQAGSGRLGAERACGWASIAIVRGAEGKRVERGSGRAGREGVRAGGRAIPCCHQGGHGVCEVTPGACLCR